MKIAREWGLVGAMLCMAGAAWGQAAPVGGIYTCIDAQGRKLTSDRPIPACMDREQSVLGASGTVVQKVGPNLTAAERAQKEAKDKAELEERNKQLDERRRDRALLVRYPNKEVHDKERAEALAQVAAATQSANTRLTDLMGQRKKLDDEMEFYKKDPTKAPLYVRRQVDENTQSIEAQKRFIADQDEETKRINSRFDADLVRLRQLWAAQAAVK